MNRLLFAGKSLKNAPLNTLSMEDLANVYAYLVWELGENPRTFEALDALKNKELDLLNEIAAMARQIDDLENENDGLQSELDQICDEYDS